jgi:acetyl esterase
LANLHPNAKAYLELFNQGPAMHEMEPQAVREMMELAPEVEVELAALAKVEDRFVPVGDGEEIKVRVYTPEGQGPFPIFVYYHGGGWVLGDLETSDASCRVLANQTNRVVVSVDYRLAPEYKFPIPLEDSYEALKWIHEHVGDLNGNAADIVVGGDSAGGNLSAAVSLLSRDRRGPAISAQVLIYPVTDLGYDTASYQEFARGFGLDKELMIWFGTHYINGEEEAGNQLVSPLRASNLSNLPPALVVVAENDVLRDEGLAFAEKLEAAGVQVETQIEEGLVHGYFTNMGVFPEQVKGTISKIGSYLSEIKVEN